MSDNQLWNSSYINVPLNVSIQDQSSVHFSYNSNQNHCFLNAPLCNTTLSWFIITVVVTSWMKHSKYVANRHSSVTSVSLVEETIIGQTWPPWEYQRVWSSSWLSHSFRDDWHPHAVHMHYASLHLHSMASKLLSQTNSKTHEPF